MKKERFYGGWQFFSSKGRLSLPHYAMKEHLKNKLMLIVIIFIIIRVLMLLVNQTLYIEEATRGLISKHIIEGDDYSVFDYSHAFAGTIVLESFLTAPFAYLFGMSIITTRLIPIIFSLVLLIMLFLFLEKYFNIKVAYISSFLYIFSPPPFVASNLFDNNMHLMGIFFSFLMMFFFYKIFFNRKATKTNFILFGIFSGLGVWIYPTPLIMLLACFIFWFAFDKIFFLKRNFFIFLASFIIGFLPRIYYKLTYHPQDMNSLRYFIYGEFFSNLKHFIPSAKRLIFKLIPYSLFDSEHLILSYGYYFIALSAFITLFYLNKKSILNLLKGLIPSKKFNINPKDIGKETFILIYPLIFLGIFSFMTGGLNSLPHRLIFIHLPIFIIISIFLVWLWNKKFKVISLLIILFLLSTGVYGNMIVIKGADPKVETTESINNLISFLDNKNIKYVYSDLINPLLLIFASNEKIIGAHESFSDIDPDFRYPQYNEMVNNASNYAFIFYNNFTNSRISNKKLFELYLPAFDISYQKQILDNKIIYYSLSEEVRPEDYKTKHIFIKNSIADQFYKSKLDNNYIPYIRLDFDEEKVIYFLTDTA